MHVIVPTIDLLFLLSYLKPIKSLKTSGFEFPVYTLIAQDNKLRIITSDKTALTLSMEIFAKVLKAGKVSVNGADLYQDLLMIKPYSNTNNSGSKEIELMLSDPKLLIKTNIFYPDSSIITQSKKLQLVPADLSLLDQERFDVPTIALPLSNLTGILTTLSKIIPIQSLDLIGLGGIMFRIRQGTLVFVVADKTRLIEISTQFPDKEAALEFILPKVSCNLLSSSLGLGETLELAHNPKTGRVRFVIDNDGVRICFISSLVMGVYPEYEEFFANESYNFTIPRNVLEDALSNFRKISKDETYKVGFKLVKNTMKVWSAAHSMNEFVSEGLPITMQGASTEQLFINASLFGSLLSPVQTDTIKLSVDKEKDRIRVYTQQDELSIRAVMSLRKTVGG